MTAWEGWHMSTEITYMRTLRIRQNALCGEMTVKVGGKSETFFAMENQRAAYDAIPQGTYTLRMFQHATLGTCLHFIEIPTRKGEMPGDFLIHATTDWRKLKGCIAVGMTPNFNPKRPDTNKPARAVGTQLVDSRQARDRIFRLLGGFQAGKLVKIRILNNSPGGDVLSKLSKLEFINRRRWNQPT